MRILAPLHISFQPMLVGAGFDFCSVVISSLTAVINKPYDLTSISPESRSSTAVCMRSEKSKLD